MEKRTSDEKRMIHEEVNSLKPEVKAIFIAAARIDALENLLVRKNVLTKEELEEEGFNVLEKKLKDFR